MSGNDLEGYIFFLKYVILYFEGSKLYMLIFLLFIIYDGFYKVIYFFLIYVRLYCDDNKYYVNSFYYI